MTVDGHRPSRPSGPWTAIEHTLLRSARQGGGCVTGPVLEALGRQLGATPCIVAHEPKGRSGVHYSAPGEQCSQRLSSTDQLEWLCRTALASGDPLITESEGARGEFWHIAMPLERDSSGGTILLLEGRSSLPRERRAVFLETWPSLATLIRLALLVDEIQVQGEAGARKESDGIEPGTAAPDSPRPAPRALLEFPAEGAERRVQNLDRIFPEIVARSQPMRGTLQAVANLAATDIPVLIEGESGTGKELVAAALHRLSARKTAPFVVENCGALPPSLIEAELFGHEKGAFTGAAKPKSGLIERAHGGTLFLDEIGELDLQQQKKLLRVLQEKKIRRLGGTEDMPVDFRLVSATNRVLEDLVKRGQFRRDLFHRLHVGTVFLPPLRERAEDIPVLIDHFNLQLARELKRPPLHFQQEALTALATYDWPGNVRELRNEVWRLLAARSGDIRAEDISPRIALGEGRSRARSLSTDGRSLSEIETELLGRVIRDAIIKAAGNLSLAARRLGISRPGLYRRMQRYGIQRTRLPAERPSTTNEVADSAHPSIFRRPPRQDDSRETGGERPQGGP